MTIVRLSITYVKNQSVTHLSVVRKGSLLATATIHSERRKINRQFFHKLIKGESSLRRKERTALNSNHPSPILFFSCLLVFFFSLFSFHNCFHLWIRARPSG